MRALLLEPDPAWLEDRRRKGLDRFDEVWDGVLHVVPSPNATHQRFESALERALYPIIEPLGLEIFHNFDLLDRRKGEMNYRQPDIAVVSPDDVMLRGINGHAELVVEILSKNDESRDKAPFYASCGIPEFWIIDPATRVAEVFVLVDGEYVAVEPDASGVLNAPRFALTFQTVDGPKLRLGWADGSTEI